MLEHELQTAALKKQESLRTSSHENSLEIDFIVQVVSYRGEYNYTYQLLLIPLKKNIVSSQSNRWSKISAAV